MEERPGDRLITFTFCRICPSRCGPAVTVEGDRVVQISPDMKNPFRWRDFCSKGRTAPELI